MSAALVAGCGGAGQDAAPSQTTPPAASSRPAAPSAAGGQLRVGATDLHLGDATTGSSSGGLEVLPNSKVPPSVNNHQGVGAGASCANADISPSAQNMRDVQAATLCLLNGERSDAGLSALGDDGQLDRAAVGHNDDMIATQYFDHNAPDGTSPVDRIQATGYIPTAGRWTVGENLAWGTGALSTPKSIVKAWMASQGHRDNILSPEYQDIGFGIAVGNPRSTDGSGATYTTTFGGKDAPSAAATAPKAAPKKAKKPKAKKARAAKARVAKARAAKARASKHG